MASFKLHLNVRTVENKSNKWLKHEAMHNCGVRIPRERINCTLGARKFQGHENVIVHNQGHPKSIFGKYLFERRFEI